ncbi:MAG: 30S ribosomal protein S16, partial [Methylococcales bacterium]|nr:30S ribosomal protein S16 [Methylococcales bacterium]
KVRQPSYRIVVADVEAPRDGRYVEWIGHYESLKDPIEYTIKEDRALYWLSVGAQPTDAVRRLLVKQGTIGRLERLKAGEAMEDLLAEYSAPAEAA